MTPDQSMLNATLIGYVAGLALGTHSDGPGRNPYIYIQSEAYAWQHGFEQGSHHFIESAVRLQPPPCRITSMAELAASSSGSR